MKLERLKVKMSLLKKIKEIKKNIVLLNRDLKRKDLKREEFCLLIRALSRAEQLEAVLRDTVIKEKERG